MKRRKNLNKYDPTILKTDYTQLKHDKTLLTNALAFPTLVTAMNPDTPYDTAIKKGK